MFNVIKMYLYRMKRSKITYLLPVIAIVFCLVEELITYFTMKEMGLDYVNLPGNIPLDGITGVDLLPIILTFVTMMIVPTMCILFSMAFLNGDMQSGYAKNIIGYTGNRKKQAVAEIVIPFLFTVGLIIVCVIVTLGVGLILFKKPEFKNVGKFFLTLLVMLMELMAFLMIIKWFADATGKYVLAMILGAVYALYSMLIYELIDIIVNRNSENPFDGFKIEKYTLLGGMVANNTNSDGKDFALSAGIAIVVFIVFFFLDVKAMEKRELKA